MASKHKTAKRRALITAGPLVLVNAVAFAGQFAYINDHVSWIMPGKVVFALALETVALFLAYMAHQALMAEDSAYGLRLSSYAFGVVIGLMNYSHYAPGMRPTFEAVATGLMSLASPWLWGIYSRRQSRDALKARGLIEPRAVKLGALRWLLWTSQSWRVFRQSVWRGISRPDEALSLYAENVTLTDVGSGQPETVLEAAESESEPLTPIELAHNKAEAVRIAMAELGESVTSVMVAQWLSERGWDVTPKYVRTAISRAKVK